MASNRSERVRNRYGICLNDSCSKCKTKEVQEIPARKDFVCAECGKPLRECPPPPPPVNLKKIIGGVVVALLIGGGAAFALLGGGEEKTAPEPEVVVIDTVPAQKPEVPVEEAKEKKEPAAPAVKDTPKKVAPKPAHMPGERYKGTLDLGYGKYAGDIVDGKPDGAGVLTYTKQQKVVSTKDVIAEPGERIEGVFENGKASFVTLYKKDGNTVKVHR
ncbi:MAG: hypothetical protein IJZ11_08095 [Bacteroidaceae bacterium]|nr:hypothetical protein [Bacteroidaceae bacterium]